VHCGHDFAGRGANHREAKDAIVTIADKGLPRRRLIRDKALSCHDALAFRFAFTQPYVGERGISEHAICGVCGGGTGRPDRRPFAAVHVCFWQIL
jgi:hypothetical protein